AIVQQYRRTCVASLRPRCRIRLTITFNAIQTIESAGPYTAVPAMHQPDDALVAQYSGSNPGEPHCIAIPAHQPGSGTHPYTPGGISQNRIDDIIDKCMWIGWIGLIAAYRSVLEQAAQ